MDTDRKDREMREIRCPRCSAILRWNTDLFTPERGYFEGWAHVISSQCPGHANLKLVSGK